MEDNSTQMKACSVCGNRFTPRTEGDDCCSPVCRTLKRTREIANQHKSKENERNARLEALKAPPKFNLTVQPNARAEWFMSLPDDYKVKFYRFLTPHDLEKVKTLASKRLADDRFYSDCYVKNGKVIVPKSASFEGSENEGTAVQVNIPSPDEEMFDS